MRKMDNLVEEMSIRRNSEGYASENSQSEDLEEENTLFHEGRVYANRNLNLSKISCYGFDMDYTLCEYISPEFDELAFTLAKQWMVDNRGYAKHILEINYNSMFPVRGLWFDKLAGNLLKVDQFGKILECYHGFRLLRPDEIRKIYPGKIQRKDESRVFIMNTLFNLAETFLIAALVDCFDENEDYEKTSTGWLKDGKEITFQAVFQDIRAAIDDMHIGSCLLKKLCLADLPRYVKKDGRLPGFLERIKQSGRKTFLLTNSDWWHTRQIMTYLLGKEGEERDSWLSYFDLVVVDACKPRFFSTSNTIQRVDTASLSLLPISTPPSGPVVYSGGDHTTITTMLGANGPDIIYAGDHLHGDVIKCRKHCEWRTLLVVPELYHEVKVCQRSCRLLKDLRRLEDIFAKDPDVKDDLYEAVDKINQQFSLTGSLFRSGTRLTYFGSHSQIWADAYTGSVNNLASYDLEHNFVPASTELAHEEVVEVVKTPNAHSNINYAASIFLLGILSFFMP